MNNDLTPAIYAALGAFSLNILLCPFIIPYLARLKFGQYVRSDGPEAHLKKAGTPTMGGIMIILSFVVVALFFVGPHADNVALVLVTMGFGMVGFLDDYIKVVMKRSLGLRAWQKMLGEILITTAFAVYLVWGRADTGQTEVYLPFWGSQTINMGYMYIPFLFLVMLGTVNGANFTDGLDGLASGVTVLITAFFLFAAWALGSPVLPLAGAAVGCLLGFLLFNSYPAKVFMGDTGSLALGGFVAAISLILKMPLFILIVALVYLIEVLSVIIQVGYYKLTRRRFFKMAPIHHSFELSGWSETKIVALFYIVTAILCLIGYLGGKAMI
ncbi:MAG: phospho-N-acetylmuramoyl-pentapeptide-transferase [Clostridiales bacterium]|jgi:phospho-N-acetylmuramoyl-pentapeptide-transferase|nr:phospho-N-acetylmuramoyl-pentapeptide-transferase [Clostridiales bacterium]